jgi:DNA-binding NarL/FixJ family response regulator
MAEDRRVIRVLIADNTRMGTELLAEAVKRNPGFQIFKSVAGEPNLLQIAAELQPNVVVSSAGLGNDASKGCELTRDLRVASPAAKIILLVDHPQREVVVEAFRAGARGVFCRAGSIDELCKCIDRVHRGQIWAGCDEIMFVLEALVQATPPKIEPRWTALLSRREQEVVRCVAEGLSNREIASRLKLSEHTVKNYLFRIFDKLGASNRAELIFLTFSSPAALTDSTPENYISISVPKDETAAFDWCRKTAGTFAAAQFMLGEMHRDGRGTPNDPIAAYMWFRIAEVTSKRTMQESRKAHAQLASKLDPTTLALAERRALEWLKSTQLEADPKPNKLALREKGRNAACAASKIPSNLLKPIGSTLCFLLSLLSLLCLLTPDFWLLSSTF